MSQGVMIRVGGHQQGTLARCDDLTLSVLTPKVKLSKNRINK
jgi:hypothetical protein